MAATLSCSRVRTCPVLGQLSRERRSGPRPLCLPGAGGSARLAAGVSRIPECDVLAEQNLAFAAALRAAGVDTEAVVYPGATHSFLEAVSIARLAQRALQEGWRGCRASCPLSRRRGGQRLQACPQAPVGPTKMSAWISGCPAVPWPQCDRGGPHRGSSRPAFLSVCARGTVG